MKIIKPAKLNVTINDVKQGECFQWGTEFFMKTSGDPHNAVSLSRGSLCNFLPQHPLTLFDAEVVIK